MHSSLYPVGQPYLGKPSDLWALGVVLFTMLYGQFPFYDNQPHELFRKIKAADYSIPRWVASCFLHVCIVATEYFWKKTGSVLVVKHCLTVNTAVSLLWEI